ncbi:MAG: biliverdin-producing heme oxygenase [Alphaproteobacteria bacterium]|nr:biliverdin-producing heme oxygenase [Alphaproteobacteria bacterium]|tara:strand:- start:5230 stop:5721 length:492 start_codon:yes stop_codon:yes gene_type:complete
MSRQDLTTPEGLAVYLQVNYLALTCLEPVMAGHQDLLAPRLPLPEIRQDLSALGAPLPQWDERPDPGNPHPLGLIYVISGSSLGARFLYLQWAKTENISVRAAGNYLSSLKAESDWNLFLRHTSDIETDEAETLQIVRSARVGFSIFSTACEQLNRGLLGQSE